MAEMVASALLAVVFEKLASAALTKLGRSKKIHSDLEESKRSLEQIQDLLNDASKKEIKEEGVKKWLNRLQHLAYDMDDILDSLTTDALAEEQAAAGNILTKVKNRISSSTTIMHGKLKKISIELQKLYDEKNKLGLEENVGRSLDRNRKYQGPKPPGVITGREGEKKILVQQLLADREPCDQNNFRVVPIVGMGGVGKTTLARLLYNEPKVEEHFDLKAWVCVSDEEFDSFKISRLIFESVAKEHKIFENSSVLQEALSGQLFGKRFLLVLDDVWTESIEDWETLMPAFLAVAPGSKIIITTRKTNLIQHLKYGNPNYNPFHLNKLSDEDSLSLFAHYALDSNNFDSNPTLKPHGEAIMRKCEGLPLALKALGRLLSTKTHEDEWKEVSESELWGLKDADDVLPALRLSYLELSPCLKQLFAYTCLFPKDCVFEKEDLIWLWMAEGFLHETTNKSMERLGEEYFDELLSRSFFECVDNDTSLFVMHDLMNDLATSVAGEFFVRLDTEMKKTIEKHSLIRHMSFVCEEFMRCTKFKAFERAKHLRTFLAVPIVVNWWEGGFYLSNKIMIDLLPQFPLLRVLCLRNLGMHEVPEFVGKLKHLRYLNLSENPIEDLPNNICRLYNLQTLIVSGCRNLSKLPNSFQKLRNLRHFDIRRTRLLCNMLLGIHELKSLQVLSDVIVGENEFGFKFLKNLRRSVSIFGLDKLQTSDQAREANLSRMRLSELSLEWSDVFDGSRNEVVEKDVLDVLEPPSDNLKELSIRSYGGLEFSKWVGDSSFHQLTDVEIEQCKKCKFLPALGQLPSLKTLSISSMDGVEKVGAELLATTGLTAFPSLERLYFENMVGWVGWSTNSGVTVFPCLQSLHIHNCPNLVEVSLEAIPSLRDLEVKRCDGGLLTSLVRVASLVTKLSIDRIFGLTDEVWGGLVQHLAAVENLSINFCDIIRHLCGCKFLVNLKKLSIYYCRQLVRIGEGEKEEEEEGSILASLRMLSLEGCNNLEHLSCPNNIEEMRIRSCRSITSVTVPTGGWEKLKSLIIGSCSSEVEEELEKVLTVNNTNVPSTLEVVQISWQNLKSITKLNCFIQLRSLVINSCPVIESFPELQNLNLLKHLKISCCESMEGPPLRSGGGSVSVGVWPPNLDSLEIGSLKRPISEWGPLPTSLVKLTLYGGSSAGDVGDVTCFPTSLLIPSSSSSSSSSLTRLELIGFKKMKRISEGLQHLTSLQHLSIHNCPKLKDLPKTLLPSLLSLEIWRCESKELKKKTSRGGSYWHLLNHIPEVDIQ